MVGLAEELGLLRKVRPKLKGVIKALWSVRARGLGCQIASLTTRTRCWSYRRPLLTLAKATGLGKWVRTPQSLMLGLTWSDHFVRFHLIGRECFCYHRISNEDGDFTYPSPVPPGCLRNPPVFQVLIGPYYNSTFSKVSSRGSNRMSPSPVIFIVSSNRGNRKAPRRMLSVVSP